MPHDQAVIQVKTEDGHQFDLIDCGSPECNKTLLFLPGLGITARHYIGFGQALAEHGIRVLIHEWRGGGSSSVRASRQANWGYRELLAQDLMAALNTARLIARQHSNGDVLIGGHSLGSQLACMTASLHPTNISGILIIAGGAPYWRSFGGWMRLKILIAAGIFSSIAVTAGYFPGKRIGFGGCESRSVITNWCRSIISGRYALVDLHIQGQQVNLEQAMADLEIPILTLRMQQDHWVPQACLDHLLAKMPNSTSEQHIINSDQLDRKADHFGWMKAPQTGAHLIAAWVNQD